MELRYNLLTEKDLPSLVDCVVKVFLYEEPMTKSLGINESEFKFFADTICKKMIRDRMSYICKDENKVVGFCLNEDLISNPQRGLEQVTYKMNPIFNLLETLDNIYLRDKEKKKNLFFHLFMVGSLPEYRGKGIAKELTQKSIDFARKRNFDRIVTEATNIKSQNLFEKYFQFKMINKINYKTFNFDNTIPFKDIGEKSCDLMELKL